MDRLAARHLCVLGRHFNHGSPLFTSIQSLVLRPAHLRVQHTTNHVPSFFYYFTPSPSSPPRPPPTPQNQRFQNCQIAGQRHVRRGVQSHSEVGQRGIRFERSFLESLEKKRTGRCRQRSACFGKHQTSQHPSLLRSVLGRQQFVHCHRIRQGR